jgi:hypothetical protein
MVYVRLARDWTDTTGAGHTAGDMVDVDAVTLAELEESGVVTPEGEGMYESTEWAGPTGDDGDWAGPTDGSGDWAGPTGGSGDEVVQTAAWAGPTGGEDDGGSGDWAGPTSDPV